MNQLMQLIVISVVHERMLAKHCLVFWVKVSEKVNGNHHVVCAGKPGSHSIHEGKQNENPCFGGVGNLFSWAEERESDYPYGVNDQEDLFAVEVGARVRPVFREVDYLFFGEEGEKVGEGIKTGHEEVVVNGCDGMVGLDCRNEKSGDVEENGTVNAHDHGHGGDLGSVS